MTEDFKFEFCYNTKFDETFRSKSLVGQYDLENKEIKQSFSGDYKLPNKWSIGLIVGNSGSGKTSIAKQVFNEFSKCKWDDRALIENFKKDMSMEDITRYLGCVGFNSVPYWLKPFHVLSNGEKSRVELARLCSEKQLVIYDEFTSLVDRDVAKSMSNSVQKLFRSENKQLVAVTCHHDVKEWLNPDWVYDTDRRMYAEGKSQGVISSNSTLQGAKIKNGSIIRSITI